MYSLSYIKNEFYTINRDVFLSERNDLISNEYDEKINNGKLRKERKNKLNNKWGYSEEIFKPYYRYMIPLLILKSYFYFIKNLGYEKSFFSLRIILGYKENFISNNVYIIFNFFIVKILLELFHYSYRSLLRTKSKVYYLNKIRYNLFQLNRLTFTT
jgi:hypothetical protein